MPLSTHHTAITRMLGIRYPIIAAPMFLVSNPDMLVEVGESGGLGAMPSLNARTTEEFQAAIREIKARTHAPFGVNLILLHNDRLLADLAVCLEERVPLIITSMGDPTELIQAAHARGLRVFCDVTNLKHAQKAKAAGADALIAVSAGAGGHAGVISPFVLLPYLKAEVGLPVVAAGGIATGGAMAAAIALGADAAYLGTRFIASAEAPVPEAFKAAIVAAGPDDIEYSAEVTGHPANFLAQSLAEFREKKAVGGADVKRWRDVWSAGQTVGLIDKVKPCAAIVADLVAEYEAARALLPSFVAPAGKD